MIFCICKGSYSISKSSGGNRYDSCSRGRNLIYSWSDGMFYSGSLVDSNNTTGCYESISGGKRSRYSKSFSNTFCFSFSRSNRDG